MQKVGQSELSLPRTEKMNPPIKIPTNIYHPITNTSFTVVQETCVEKGIMQSLINKLFCACD